MSRTRTLLLLAFLAQASFTCAHAAPPAKTPTQGVDTKTASAEQEQFFETKIRPLLANHCIECHGAETQENDLRLDSREAIIQGGERGTAVNLENVDASWMLKAVRHTDDLEMPPGKKLPDGDIANLRQWIKSGATWPKSAAPVTTMSKEDRYAQIRATHWSFQQVTMRPLPDAGTAWSREPVDRYVAKHQTATNVTPSETADRRTLLRRATFDLIGLPPTFEQVTAFETHDVPDAFEREVDRLLASPRYGERWGRHWLDVARYADTKGYAFQKERRYAYAYTYRDYVINAFNADLPYNRFLQEQLAADQLDHGGDNSSLAALGLLTVGRRFNDIHNDRDDLIDVVTRGMLGLTVACARCHDHKYDAIPTDDYYSLYGVFASIHEPAELPVLAVVEDAPEYIEFKKKLDALTAAREQKRVELQVKLVETARANPSEYLVRAITKLNDEQLKQLKFLSLSPDDWRPKLVTTWRQYLVKHSKPNHSLWGPLHDFFYLPNAEFSAKAPEVVSRWLAKEQGTADGQINPLIHESLSAATIASKANAAHAYGVVFQRLHAEWKDKVDAEKPPKVAQITSVIFADDGPNRVPLTQLKQYLNRADREAVQKETKKIDQHKVESPGAPPRAMVVADNAQPHNPQILLRGNPGRLGKGVPRRFLYAVAGENRQPFPHGSGRLDLAEAITAESNPLTRRVIANRVWMHHFGQPLVDTPSDFGIRCDMPQQIELLDYLAASMLDDDWSLKQLHRRIMHSHVYRQASIDRPDQRERDPENRLLWRMNRRRLEFEPMRDSLLAIADSLDRTTGGKSVDIIGSPYSRRRSVYGFIDRQDLPNLFRAFDFANPDQSSPRRPNTTVPQQTLFMMNSTFVTKLATHVVASDEFSAEKDREARIRWLYTRLFARQPTNEELTIGSEFIATPNLNLKEALFAQWQQYVQLLMLSNEFVFVD